MANKFWSLIIPLIIVLLGYSAIAVGLNNQNIKNKANPAPQTITISLRPIKEPVSAIAIRLIFEDISFSADTSFFTLNSNSQLTQQDWSYPVKKITKEDDKLVIDLALVNISTKGYEISTETNIAEILDKQAILKNKDFQFDKSLSKIVLKNGSEIEINNYVNIK